MIDTNEFPLTRGAADVLRHPAIRGALGTLRLDDTGPGTAGRIAPEHFSPSSDPG